MSDRRVRASNWRARVQRLVFAALCVAVCTLASGNGMADDGNHMSSIRNPETMEEPVRVRTAA